MCKAKKTTIEVQGAAITILSKEEGDYISLTDMVRNFEGGGALIEQWLKNKDTVLFLGVWERLHNPDFNSLEFEGIRNEAGRNSVWSAKLWADNWLPHRGETQFQSFQFCRVRSCLYSEGVASHSPGLRA